MNANGVTNIIQDLKAVHVNLAKTTVVSAGDQQRAAGRRQIRKQDMPDQVILKLINNDTHDRTFGLLGALHVDRTPSRFKDTRAVVLAYVDNGSGAALCDITCDLPAGIAALQDKLRKGMAVIVATGFSVDDDADVDQYRKNAFVSYVNGLEQTDSSVKDIATRVSGDVNNRTKLIWPRVFQANDSTDVFLCVKAGVTLTVTLEISEWGFLDFLPTK